MKNLPLNSLRALALVYQANGVRSAARRLNVSHSAVSRHIRELEAWLGVPLMARREGRRHLEFTENGKTLGEAVVTGLSSVENTIMAIREARQSNSVVVATTASIAARWLLPRLPAFQKRHLDIEISVLAEQALVEPDGKSVDISLRMGRGPWPSVNCIPIMDDALFPVIHPSLLTDNPFDNPVELFSRHPLIHDRDPETGWAKWFKQYPLEGIDTRRGPRFVSSDLVIRAATQGLGVSLVRERLVADEIASGALIKPFGDKSIRLTDAYWIITPNISEPRRIVNTVVSWIRNQAE